MPGAARGQGLQSLAALSLALPAAPCDHSPGVFVASAAPLPCSVWQLEGWREGTMRAI